jgi:hypothetical protein
MTGWAVPRHRATSTSGRSARSKQTGDEMRASAARVFLRLHPGRRVVKHRPHGIGSRPCEPRLGIGLHRPAGPCQRRDLPVQAQVLGPRRAGDRSAVQPARLGQEPDLDGGPSLRPEVRGRRHRPDVLVRRPGKRPSQRLRPGVRRAPVLPRCPGHQVHRRRRVPGRPRAQHLHGLLPVWSVLMPTFSVQKAGNPLAWGIVHDAPGSLRVGDRAPPPRPRRSSTTWPPCPNQGGRS